VVELVINEDDLDGAVYPVTVDPTVPISGTAAIEDSFLTRRFPDGLLETANWGGRVDIFAGQAATGFRYSIVMRIDESLIPAGTITAFDASIWQQAHPNSGNADDLNYYAIKDANNWVEGTSNGTSEVGACSWFSTQNTIAIWAGGSGALGGCRISGTDYDADRSPPSFAFPAKTAGGDQQHITSLDTAWATAWRDATRVNNGVVLLVGTEANDYFFSARSTEAGANQPTFSIDYTVPSGTAARYFFMGG
jgi:hypothetical protein